MTATLLVLAGVVILVGAALPTFLHARRTRRDTERPALAAARAHAEAVGLLLDTADPDTATDLPEARRLYDAAVATLDAADGAGSALTADRAEELLDRARVLAEPPTRPGTAAAGAGSD